MNEFHNWLTIMLVSVASTVRLTRITHKVICQNLQRLKHSSTFLQFFLGALTVFTLVNLSRDTVPSGSGFSVSSIVTVPGAKPSSAYFGAGIRFVLFNGYYGQFNNQLVGLINAISIARKADAVLVLPYEKLGRKVLTIAGEYAIVESSRDASWWVLTSTTHCWLLPCI